MGPDILFLLKVGRDSRRPRAVPARGPASDDRLLLLFLDDRAALVGALLLGLHLHPALALAVVLAGAGVAVVRGRAGAVALARVDARALHGAFVLLALVGGELVTHGHHADDRRRNGKTDRFVALHVTPP